MVNLPPGDDLGHGKPLNDQFFTFEIPRLSPAGDFESTYDQPPIQVPPLFASNSVPANNNFPPELVGSSIGEVSRAAYRTVDLEPPAGVLILKPNDRVQIRGARAVIFDIDDTVLHKSGEFAHDGHEARFALGVRRALSNLGVHFEPDVDNWNSHYRVATGRGEQDVIELLAKIASSHHSVNITPELLAAACKEVLEFDFNKLMKNVNLSEGVLELILYLRSIPLPVWACSSSSEAFIHKALHHKDILDKFDSLLCGAAKKIGTDRYSGNPIANICQSIGVSPDQVVMIGDSVSDSATHQLAGGRVSLLYVPDIHDQKKVTSLFRNIGAYHASHSGEINPHDRQIIAFESYHQIDFIPNEDTLEAKIV